ncbi:MAG: helix-turn-helix transcriptional regulator [Thermogemmatispora sp.]|jgi:DNA-binding transcriptional ArsR family regulator|uniref:Transcriptional regulator n=1 Tax=Thermogemmatispora aurantia TaxID=2045279 RepID=A0A5J4K859_9CHLR|nr:MULTISPECIES: metalloregulator ArsR/SmtB family transcription factor [Thermogemmatispora]MBE3564976.1 helix-turn-helix transcriptional regulator [Thermogemmatispora sp.]GER83705.1 transcriptional regulator [Thermogemmatispora aurantia]
MATRPRGSETRGSAEATDLCQVRAVHPEQVEAVRQSLLPLESAMRTAALFAVLNDPTRLQVLFALLHAPAGELCVCDLAAGLGRDDTTISHQLRVLRTQGIVSMRKVGRVVYYRLVDDHVRQLLELGLAHASEPAGGSPGTLSKVEVSA